MQPEFLASTLEDERRAVKVAGETRIPAGTYEIKLRSEGGLTKKYAEKFADIHQGMLWLQDVPNFKWIYIHVGNDDDDTEGCILVGQTCDFIRGFAGRSKAAYRDVYKLIVGALNSGEQVFIEIQDIA